MNDQGDIVSAIAIRAEAQRRGRARSANMTTTTTMRVRAVRSLRSCASGMLGGVTITSKSVARPRMIAVTLTGQDMLASGGILAERS